MIYITIYYIYTISLRYDVKHKIMYCENFKVRIDFGSMIDKHKTQIHCTVLCPDSLQYLGHAPAEAEQHEYCRVSPGGGGQVGSSLISSLSCHDIIFILGTRFPALLGQARLRFLRSGTTFLVVRDPFERLVSAYLVTA